MMQAQDFPLISHSPKRWAEFVKTRTPILESIIPLDSRGLRYWKALDRGSLLAHTEWRLEDEGISGRKELRRADQGLYKVLVRQKLLDEVGLPDTRGVRRDWKRMESEELVAFAKGFIAEKGIRGRAELNRADGGLCYALRSRGLLEEVGMPDSQGKHRDWARMRNKELIAFTKGFVAEKGICGKMELASVDMGLYLVLLRRKLLNAVGLAAKRREWARMERKELVALAKKFVSEMGIRGRWELEKADRGLCRALRERQLLSFIFSDLESARHADAVDGVLDALESFGDGE